MLNNINIFMYPNDPNINRKYNYVYRIVNILTGKEYIGVHRTDNINDGYMGSGKIIKRAIAQNGVDNFKKEILSYHETYREALQREKQLVTIEYCNSANTYNIKEGGYGNCQWSEEYRKKISEIKKQQWSTPEWREEMVKKIYTTDRASKISKKLKGIKRANKHNTHPDKIYKTAKAHKGMKRSDAAKIKMSLAAINLSSEIKQKRSGKGMKYVYNPNTKAVLRIKQHDIIPEGFIKGSGPKNKNRYKSMNKNSFFGYCPVTLKIKRFQENTNIPQGWVKGRPSKLQKHG